MRPLTFLAICAFLLSGSAQAGQSGRDYRAVVQVVSQNYCYGDDDVFTVSLDLRIEVVNSARTTLFLLLTWFLTREEWQATQMP